MIRSMPNNNNYRSGWNRVFGKKKFVVVCGPGRSGTSLATSLVEACGFSLGKVNDFQHESYGGLRHGYGENPLTNCAGEDIEQAIDELEEQGANCVKLIHLYAQWIPRLIKRGYDLKIIVTTRDEKEIWESGMDIYPGWRPNAIGSICGTAKKILAETKLLHKKKELNVCELPFCCVVRKDYTILRCLTEFLRKDDTTSKEREAMIEKMEQIIKPEIVQHTKIEEEWNL